MAEERKRLTPEELAVEVARCVGDARQISTDDYARQRSEILKRYELREYGDEVPGQSTFVASDVAETVDGIMPGLMRVFTSGERAVQFDPVGKEDEDAAEQETDVVNHLVMQKGGGFDVLHGWFKSALLDINAVVKVRVDESKRVEEEEYHGLTDLDLAQLEQDLAETADEFEPIEQEPVEVPIPDESGEIGQNEHGEPWTQPGYDVKYRITTREPMVRIEPVPPEEFGITSGWTSLDLTDCPCVFHHRDIPEGELVAMGYDEDQIAELRENIQWANLREEHQERHRDENHGANVMSEDWVRGMRPVQVVEAYLLIDYEGTGILQRVRVMVGGSEYAEVLIKDGEPDIEVVDRCPPFAVLTAMPMPYRFFGRTPVQSVIHTTAVMTSLWRHMLTNIWKSNHPTRIAKVSALAKGGMEALLSNDLGQVVPVNQQAQPGDIYDLPPQAQTAPVLEAIRFLQEDRERRTGVSRMTEGIDANAINKTMGGIAMLQEAGRERTELIARVFAETGVKHLFRIVHTMARRYLSRRLTINLRGNYVQVAPREWKRRTDMTVSVGLGTGNREQQMQALMQIAGMQKEAMMGQLPIVTPDNIYNTAVKMVEAAGLKNPELYWTDPQQQPPKDESDPAAEMQQQMMQAQLQLAQEQLKNEQAKLEQDWQKTLLEDDRKRDEAKVKAVLEAHKIGAQEALQQADMAAKITAMMQPPALPQRGPARPGGNGAGGAATPGATPVTPQQGPPA